jgi:hypothetical protein
MKLLIMQFSPASNISPLSDPMHGCTLHMMTKAPADISGMPVEYPAYSPDLAPCDLWTFSMLKCEPEGQKLSNGTEGKTSSCCYTMQDAWPPARFRRGWGTTKNVAHEGRYFDI